MNIVDYIIIGMIGISMLFGFYRGFVSSVLNTGGCIGSLILSFTFYPKVAAWIQNSGGIISGLQYLTDSASRIGDQSLALTKVADLTGEQISGILAKVSLPAPISQLLESNLVNQVFSSIGLENAAAYVNQTIMQACLNVISFILCFILIYILLSVVINAIKAIFRFPLLKQLDWLVGGIFGFLRGLIIVFAFFALVPMVNTVVSMDIVNEQIAMSTLAPIFNNGNLILSIMNRGF